MLDTLTLARELKDAGVEPRQADAITHVVRQAVEHSDPATRADLDTHRAEVRADLDTHRAEVRADFDTHRTEVRADLDTHRAEVRADIAALEARLIRWMIPTRSTGSTGGGRSMAGPRLLRTDRVPQ